MRHQRNSCINSLGNILEDNTEKCLNVSVCHIGAWSGSAYKCRQTSIDIRFYPWGSDSSKAWLWLWLWPRRYMPLLEEGQSLLCADSARPAGLSAARALASKLPGFAISVFLSPGDPNNCVLHAFTTKTYFALVPVVMSYRIINLKGTSELSTLVFPLANE